MLGTVTCFQIICDNHELCESMIHLPFIHRGNAIKTAQGKGWIIKDNHCTCPKCHRKSLKGFNTDPEEPVL